jgi:hypothetical protein
MRRALGPIALSLAVGVTVWAALKFSAPRPHASEAAPNFSPADYGAGFDSPQWQAAIEKVKADRAGFGANVALEVPSQLRHYEERHWFLAAQVAEVKKHSLQTCQDYVDLASMINRKEMVAVPAVTEDFVLMGVGARSDDGPFTKYVDDQTIPLFDEAQLRDEYARIEAARPAAAKKSVAEAKSSDAKKAFRAKTTEKKSAAANPPPANTADQKSLVKLYYDQPAERQRLFADYETVHSLAQNFRGRAYDLQNPNDRQTLKMTMLSSLRPTALKVLQEIAADYRRQFDRPLPVSSLVRPEQYQHTLRRYNRAATTIETPPHSTGLAFDIDYRYMSVAEQNFVMADLARLKDAGRIEVLRERNANFHVFAFIDGVRPGDELIAASLQDAGSPSPEEETKEAADKNKPAPNKKAVKPEKPKHVAEKKSKPRVKRR